MYKRQYGERVQQGRALAGLEGMLLGLAVEFFVNFAT